MKKILLAFGFAAMAGSLFAQDRTEEEAPKFDPNRVFVGGSVGLGLGFGSNTSSWAIGAFPQVGYSFSDWFDAGVIVNANYNSQKFDYGSYVEKFKSFNYGTGAFLRVFPLQSIFIQAQPEINWINYKIEATNEPNIKATVSAPSVLLGIGYGQRMVGQTGFFTSVMIDVVSNPNSPYRDNRTNSIIPIIRAGFYVYLSGNRNKNN